MSYLACRGVFSKQAHQLSSTPRARRFQKRRKACKLRSPQPFSAPSLTAARWHAPRAAMLMGIAAMWYPGIVPTVISQDPVCAGCAQPRPRPGPDYHTVTTNDANRYIPSDSPVQRLHTTITTSAPTVATLAPRASKSRAAAPGQLVPPARVVQRWMRQGAQAGSLIYHTAQRNIIAHWAIIICVAGIIFRNLSNAVAGRVVEGCLSPSGPIGRTILSRCPNSLLNLPHSASWPANLPQPHGFTAKRQQHSTARRR